MTVKVVVKSPDGEPVGEELKFVVPDDGKFVIRLPIDEGRGTPGKRSFPKRMVDGVTLVASPAALPSAAG